MAKLRVTWTGFSSARTTPGPQHDSEAVIANGYYIAVTTADGFWRSTVVAVDANGAVISAASPGDSR